MNTSITKLALAVVVAGLAVVGTGVPANAHPAPVQHNTLWCC